MAYDDFEDGDYTNDPTWSDVGGTATVAVSEASKKNGVYGIEFTTASNTYKALQTTIGAVATLDTWTWIRTSNVAGTWSNYGFISSNAVSTIGIATSNFVYRDSTGYHDMPTATPANNTWYILRMVYDGTNTDFYVYDDSFAELTSVTGTTPYTTGNVVKIEMFVQNMNGTTYLDDVGYGDRDPPAPPVTGQYMSLQKYW